MVEKCMDGVVTLPTYRHPSIESFLLQFTGKNSRSLFSHAPSYLDDKLKFSSNTRTITFLFLAEENKYA